MYSTGNSHFKLVEVEGTQNRNFQVLPKTHLAFGYNVLGAYKQLTDWSYKFFGKNGKGGLHVHKPDHQLLHESKLHVVNMMAL